jgi:hypothetical protein
VQPTPSFYQAGQLPAGCKPLIVFINTKSGPQIGDILRQRFLRALHPLQVVELPRQAPDAALHLFAPVAAHCRILVIGGDGSGETRGGGGGEGDAAADASDLPLLLLLLRRHLWCCHAFTTPPPPLFTTVLGPSCSLSPRPSSPLPSVAWILATLDKVKAAQAEAGNSKWKAPPVGVLPLGTGG